MGLEERVKKRRESQNKIGYGSPKLAIISSILAIILVLMTYVNSPSTTEENNFIITKDNFYNGKEASDLLLWPVKDGEITGDFKRYARGDYIIYKTVIKAKEGTEVVSADDGTVTGIRNDSKVFGNTITIEYNNGLISLYSCCDTIKVNVNDKVSKGQVIATVGKRRDTKESQLYFDIRKNRIVADSSENLSSN